VHTLVRRGSSGWVCPMNSVDNVVPLRASDGQWEDDPPELNLRVLACLGRYLRDRCGPDALERATGAVHLRPHDLDGKTRWVSVKRFEGLLKAARAELESDEEFNEACLYEYAATAQGLVRYLLTLSSPLTAYERGCQMFGLASRVSTLQAERLSNRTLRLVYKTTRAESKLACVTRRASLSVLPVLWGLPRARVESKKCVAHGDDCCVYDITVYETSRRLPAALGALAGAVMAGLGLALESHFHGAWLFLPVMGALIGHILELRRVNRHNIAAGERSHELLRELAEDDSEARRELMELHQRQNEWLGLMEEQLAERTAALQEVVQRIREFQRSTHTHIRGLSHDLRNPLHLLLLEADVLHQHRDSLGPVGPDLVDEHVGAVRKIEQLLAELMAFVTSERVTIDLAPAGIDVPQLTERMRRQLRALAHGKTIRLSVFRVREAPDSVFVDPMLLDRIVDNLLTNAVKYTERGSIVIEVGGTPGFLTLKISDTGRGIEPERLEAAFEGGATQVSHRASGSYGVGLSIVVELLRRIDGRLEVMSKPNLGTTFWVHIPVDTRQQSEMFETEPRSSKILTIRKGMN
jgi:signal transduction histidine kinase